MAIDKNIEGSFVYASTATALKEKAFNSSKTVRIFKQFDKMGVTLGTFVSGSDGDWLLINYDAGKYGWIHRDTDHPYYVNNFVEKIGWDSLPQIAPNWLQNIGAYISGSTWDGPKFQTWHAQLKEHYGLEKANTIFLTYWKKQTWLSKAYDSRTFSTSFRDYMRANGILDSLYSGGVIQNTIKTAANVKDLAVSAVNTASNITSKITDKLLTDKPGSGSVDIFTMVKIGAIAFLALYAYNTFKKNRT